MAEGGRIELRSSKLFLCEGVEDAEFLRQLRNERVIGQCDIRPVQDIGGSAGVGGFRLALEEIVRYPNFRRLVQHIVMVADCDTGGGKTFNSLCAQIRNANKDENVGGRFVIPTKAFETEIGAPSMTIALIPPHGNKGALESLLWESLKSRHKKQADCANTACESAGIMKANSKWNQAQLDKSRVRITIALLNKRNPNVGLGRIWSEAPGILSATDAAFATLSKKLAAL